MNDQQRMRQRAHEDSVKRNQVASEVVNRANKLARDQAIKVHTDQHRRMVEAGRRTGENVHDHRNGMGKFIFVFIVMAVIGLLLFALFVLIVSSIG